MNTQLNFKDAMRFKKMLHKGKPVLFQLYDGNGEKNVNKQLQGKLLNKWNSIAKYNMEGSSVAILINTSDGKGRKSENITNVNAVFIDYDGGDLSVKGFRKMISKSPIKPHAVIQTSPGNFHAYWLTKDVPLDKFKEIQQKLARKFGTDESVCDLPRVMRLPGTLNHKHGQPFLVRVLYMDAKPERISMDRFVREVFGQDAKEPKSTKIISPDGSNEIQRIQEALQAIPANERRTWITVGMALNAHLGEAGYQYWKNWSEKSSKFDEVELKRQWKSFDSNGPIKIGTLFWLEKTHLASPSVNESSRSHPTTQLELAAKFAESSASLLRHCENEQAWYAFVDGRWVKSEKAAKRFAMQFLCALKEAARLSGDSKYQEFVGKFQSSASAHELLRAAESDAKLSATSADFDQKKHLLGVQLVSVENAIDRFAVINLAKSKFRLALPKDNVLRLAGAHYDPKAECPQWRSFLKEVTKGDEELAQFLQLAVGYTLWGHTKEQVLFVLIGSGGNGKGVFSHTIQAVLGEYAVTMQSNLLKPGAINANSPSPALMKLREKRLWVCSEVYKGMVMDEALTKQLTGGDLVSGRTLYAEQTEFVPVGKLWLSVNSMPRVRHDDDGMWRRIIPIPFNAKFAGKKRDNDLEDKLMAELSGILNWAVEGARKYAERGKLELPKASTALCGQLRTEVDTVGIWLDAGCCLSDGAKLPSQAGYDNYRDAMKREKMTPLSQKEFKADLVRRGFKHKAGRKFNYFVGLNVKEGGSQIK